MCLLLLQGCALQSLDENAKLDNPANLSISERYWLDETVRKLGPPVSRPGAELEIAILLRRQRSDVMFVFSDTGRDSFLEIRSKGGVRIHNTQETSMPALASKVPAVWENQSAADLARAGQRDGDMALVEYRTASSHWFASFGETIVDQSINELIELEMQYLGAGDSRMQR